jgi:hypothetical protein
MSNKASAAIPQSRPVSTTSTLANGYELAITTGIWCPWCGDDIRPCDAEPLDGGLRLVCQCGHQILHFKRSVPAR